MSTSQAIPADLTERAHAAFVQSRADLIARNAVTASGIRSAARDVDAAAAATATFDIQLEQGGPTDQKRSGRCWMFASLNTMRFRVMKKLGVKSFELSQAYPLFWDKYERANWFFENVIASAAEPLAGREVAFLLTDPLCDGGQWDMFRSLVKKYGVVPKEAMPETASSSNTGDLNKYLTRYLRSGAKRLRDAAAAGAGSDELAGIKAELLQGVYRALAISLGEPPARFDVRIRDEKNELKASGTYTPLEFFREFVDMDLDAYISIINAPTADKPYLRSYTVKYLGNVIEDGGVHYVNLPIEAGLDKAARLDYGESLMTHAMTLQGVNLGEDGEPTRWRVENSWGEEHGKKGYDIASAAWFDEYVYQVVVDKKYLTPEELAAYESEPIELAPWDPMGALA